MSLHPAQQYLRIFESSYLVEEPVLKSCFFSRSRRIDKRTWQDAVLFYVLFQKKNGKAVRVSVGIRSGLPQMCAGWLCTLGRWWMRMQGRLCFEWKGDTTCGHVPSVRACRSRPLLRPFLFPAMHKGTPLSSIPRIPRIPPGKFIYHSVDPISPIRAEKHREI